MGLWVNYKVRLIFGFLHHGAQSSCARPAQLVSLRVSYKVGLVLFPCFVSLFCFLVLFPSSSCVHRGLAHRSVGRLQALSVTVLQSSGILALLTSLTVSPPMHLKLHKNSPVHTVPQQVISNSLAHPLHPARTSHKPWTFLCFCTVLRDSVSVG